MLFTYVMRGLRHRLEHRPCQDHALATRSGEVFILAAADGHGGKPYVRSGMGARIACRAAQKILLDPQLSEEQYGIALKECFDALVQKHMALRPFLPWELERMRELPEQSYAYGTTLMAARLTPECTWMVHIGDGAIHAIGENGRFLPFPAPVADSTGETDSLVTPDAPERMRTAWFSFPAAVVLMHTDGYDPRVRRPWPMLEAIRTEHPEQPLRKVLSGGGNGDDLATVLFWSPELMQTSPFLDGLARERYRSALEAEHAELSIRYRELGAFLRSALEKLRRTPETESVRLLEKTAAAHAEYKGITKRLQELEASLNQPDTEDLL